MQRSSSYLTSDADLVIDNRLNQIRALALIRPSGVPAVFPLDYPKQFAEFTDGHPRQFFSPFADGHGSPV
jgi:hypothetical protein